MAAPAARQVRPEWEHEERERDELIARFIQSHPDRLGRAYAIFRDDGQSVATIIRAIQCGDGIAKVAASWDLSEDAVRAAIKFYHRHRPYFDARILLEDDPFLSDW